MRIGELAAQANVNAQTVRLYERIGLLQKPKRLASGYRDYAPDVVERVRFIKRAQKLGFTLGEIKTLMGLRGQGSAAQNDVRALAASKLAEIERRIGQLQEMRDAIEHGMKVCQCAVTYPLCLFFAAGEAGSEPEKRR